jgi:hypothetical protein
MQQGVLHGWYIEVPVDSMIPEDIQRYSSSPSGINED